MTQDTRLRLPFQFDNSILPPSVFDHLRKALPKPSDATYGDVIGFSFSLSYRDFVSLDPLTELLVLGESGSFKTINFEQLSYEMQKELALPMITAQNSLMRELNLNEQCQAMTDDLEAAECFDLLLLRNSAFLTLDSAIEEVYEGLYGQAKVRTQEHVDHAMLMIAPEPYSNHAMIQQTQDIMTEADIFRTMQPVPLPESSDLITLERPCLEPSR